MTRESRSARPRLSPLIWAIGTSTLLTVLLMGVVANLASASAYELDSKEHAFTRALQGVAVPTATLKSAVTPAVSLQSTVAPTSAPESTVAPTANTQIESTSTFSFSLAALGYGEEILSSPYGQAQYFFRLPENWVIEGDADLELDLSYVYHHQGYEEEYPILFGELVISLDGETLEVFSIDVGDLEHHRLRVTLPESLLTNPNRTQHVIGVTLSAGNLCEVLHRARLAIHPTSNVSLAYSQRPPALDLGRYPQPFYQQAFEPDNVRFVLPSHPTTNDLSSAAALAAKLGDLTNGRMVISATTDLELSNLVGTAPATFDEHLIVVGQPQHNQLLPLLNNSVDLPVSLHQQQLHLVAQGPTAVAPGEIFTYTFTITNPLDQALDMYMVDPLPAYTEFVTCSPGCVESDDDNTITWRNSRLAPDGTIDFSLTLRASDILTGAILENVVTLIEDDLGPVNAATLTSTAVSEPSEAETQVFVSREGDYFFVYENKTLAEGDGVIQEIVSPWSENRSILIVTGLNDEAVRKASLAMSSETHFPGMRGPVALVREALSSIETDDASPTVDEITLADLGYSDQVVRGGGTVKRIDYYFWVPYGWQLTEDVSIDLYFGHSRLIDYENSGLTVFLNNRLIASTALNEKTADDGHLHISLADANVRSGRSNQLTLEIDLDMPGVCVDHEQALALIENNSRIFLAHREGTDPDLNLNLFPYPFHLNPALTDLLFVLPTVPSIEELGNVLRLTASLGDSAAGKTTLPVVMVDSDLPLQGLEGYHVIAVGRASRNALIQQVNAELPQPFLPGSDEIDQQLDDVVFRLPPGLDLGYAELIPSPWNEERALLAVTGTTDESVNWVVNVLSDRPWVLGNGGNLALITDDKVNTIDTRTLTSKGAAGAVATAVLEGAPEAVTAPTETATVGLSPTSSLIPNPDDSATEQVSRGTDRPTWLIPLMGITGLLVIAIFAFVFLQQTRGRS